MRESAAQAQHVRSDSPALTSAHGGVRYSVRLARRPGITSVTATEARKRLYRLLDEVSQSHEPVAITGKRGNAVLVGEDDWRAVQETLHLLSIPGMRGSIVAGMATPLEQLSEKLDW
jgi:prevent-host-death family protein